MHEDETLTDDGLVRALLAEQQPRWADRPRELVASYGTDHDVWRISGDDGPDLALRLPRMSWAADQATREARWLPRFAPHLPLAVQTLVARGRPGAGYPYSWSVWEWLPGTDAHHGLDTAADLEDAARRLGDFVVALRGIDTEGEPAREPGQRGGPLRARHEDVLESLAELGSRVDGPAVRRAWDEAVEDDPYDGPPVWFHGDLMPGNVLVDDHRVSAVIDWGSFGVGDAATDLIAAWHLLDARSRRTFAEAASLGEIGGDAAWRRGRGWAVVQAVGALAYYWDTNPGMVRQASRALAAVLSEAPGPT